MILYGKVKANWVNGQLEEFVKLKTRRKKPLRLEALYLESEDDPDDLSIFDPDVVVIDARTGTEINLAALEPLIKPLWGET